MDNSAVVGPALGAAIAGVSLLLSNRLITYWTARQKRLADGQANRDAAAVAKITTDEQDRQRVSANMWAIVKDLRDEVAALRAENAAQQREIGTLRGRVAELERQVHQP